MTVPGYFAKCCSSHWTLSASRWLVGSSSSSRSGCSSSSLHSATRRRSPPDRWVTGSSPGGQRKASIACSMRLSSSQPFACSIFSISSPCSASSESKSASGSPIAADTSSNLCSQPRSSATPSSTLPRTVFASSSGGSCCNNPTDAPAASWASPFDGWSRPAMILRTLDLPAPLGPTTPILAPGRNAKVTSSRITLSPWSLRTLRMVYMYCATVCPRLSSQLFVARQLQLAAPLQCPSSRTPPARNPQSRPPAGEADSALGGG